MNITPSATMDTQNDQKGFYFLGDNTCSFDSLKKGFEQIGGMFRGTFQKFYALLNFLYLLILFF